jgi:hypothetical protein
MVPGPSRGSTDEREGEETSGSEMIPASLQQDRLGASPAVCRGDAAARRGRASLEAADGNHLVPRPKSDGEGVGAAAQDRVGAVVEWLKGRNQATPTDPDKGGKEQLGWQPAWQVSARLVPRQRRGRNMQDLRKNFDKCQLKVHHFVKFIWQDNLCTENCLCRGKTSVFPQLCSESEDYKG